MNFIKAKSFDQSVLLEKIMGPNPLLLTEELMHIASDALVGSSSRFKCADPARGGIVREDEIMLSSAQSRVLDLGSGTGITSVMLAREYGLTAYAVDLWSDPDENRRFFNKMGLGERQIIPVKVDVQKELPFEEEFFDAAISIDSYNYFGRDASFLDAKLAPYVKRDGLILIAVPGMKKDCHDNLPSCLLASWNAEQLEYMHDIAWWTHVFEQSYDTEMLCIKQMECTAAAWHDWLTCENKYAQSDKAAIEAGALEYLNTIAVVLRRK